MSDSTPPRRQPFGYGKTAPARPQPQPQPPKAAPRPAPTAAPRPAAKVAPQPAFEVVEEEDPGFEVVDEKPAKKTAVAARKSPRSEEPVDRDPEPDNKPGKSKRKKKRQKYSDKLLQQVDQEQESRDAALRDYEWIFPSIVLFIGVTMMIVGAFGTSTLTGIATLGYVCVYLIVAVPLIIAGFMLVGMLVGIEYGRIGPAILKIAAITCVANGIMCIGDWMKLPGFVVFPISCFITFGIFMTQFDLDTWEANVSAGVVNVCSFLANIALVAFIVVGASSVGGGGGSDTDPEDENPPSETKKDRKRDRDPGGFNPGNPPVMNEEFDDD